MFLDTTKTGLMPLSKRSSDYLLREKLPKLEFQKCIQPAPIAAKPFATLLNPFRRGCSIFCNHPNSNKELKLAIKKSKKKVVDDLDYGVDEKALADRVGDVLEEMLCRYRQTPDSTSPDEGPPPRTTLVLDLRRTISQETLSTTMGRATSRGLSSNLSPTQSSLSGLQSSINKIPQSPPEKEHYVEEVKSEEDEEILKRRGKLKKKKKKTSNISDDKSKEVIGLIEPGETQISTCKDFVDEMSWQGSSAPTPLPTLDPMDPRGKRYHLSDIFDHKTLRHLRRCLTAQQAESEFRRIWRKVLKEALSVSDVQPEDELAPEVKSQVETVEISPDDWLNYPRTFKYSSVRFDLPVDKRLLNDMTPLQYLKDFVSVDKELKPLYNHIYKKHATTNGTEYLTRKNLMPALADLMGRKFTDEEEHEFNQLLNIEDGLQIDLRTWIGICSACERIFGLAFSSGEAPDLGKIKTLEEVDFDLLNKELPDLNLNEKLHNLLIAIQKPSSSQELDEN